MVTNDEKNAQLVTLFLSGMKGDAVKYQQFLSEISHYLRRFIARRVPAADVEDVLQEVLVSIHKARHTYDGKRSVLPWVSAIARYRLLDYLRKHYARMGHLQTDLEEVENTLAADVTETSELSEYISEEVKHLPERQQKILYLMHTEGYTAKEVGTQLGMNESAVKVAAHRAYKLIKTKLRNI